MDTYERIPLMIHTHRHSTPYTSTIINSGGHTCRFDKGTKDISDADMVLFSDIEVNRYMTPPPRRPNQLWAFFSKEPQIKLTSKHISQWNGLFNYSATFVRDNEGSLHIFRAQIKRLQANGTMFFTPKPSMRPVRILWFVSHCSLPPRTKRISSAREEYILELSRYVTIDIFTSNSKECGRRFGNLVQNSKKGEPKMDDYMFYLSFENSLCKDYVSEKVWKVLESNSTTIPIALGGTSIEEYEAVTPPNSFLHVKNFTSPAALARHLQLVSTSDTAFHYYNQWRNEFQLITRRIQHADRSYMHHGGKTD